MGRDHLRKCAATASLALVLLIIAAAPAFADDSPPPLPPAVGLEEMESPAALLAAETTPALTRRRVIPWSDPYRPSVPVGETRSGWTTLAVPPTVFALTDAECMTPLRGRLALNAQRISDDRVLEDNAGRFWETDGEMQVLSLEYVSPGICIHMGGRNARLHFAGSVHVYTQQTGIFDHLRNWVEENLLNASDAVLDEHDIGGKELSIDGDDMLGNSTLTKARFSAKLQLPDVRLGCGCFHSAVSLGGAPPAWGSMKSSGNEDFQPDLTLAYGWDISSKWRITGATTVSYPGTTRRFDELGVDTVDVLYASILHLEWWPSGCWGFSLGFSYNSPYLEDTDLPMDDASTYFHIGIQWRMNRKSELYLVWSENLDTEITTFNTDPGETDFSDSQKDADFTFLLGWRLNF